MIKSYFFIPANKLKYIKKSEEMKKIDYRIFDFEDSILDVDVDKSIEYLKSTIRRDTDWIRIPISERAFKKVLQSTLEMGYYNFIIPKFKGINELSLLIEPILAVNKKSRFILLIEHPKTLIEIEDILKKYSNCIHGIGLGSHDFSLKTGIANDLDLLRYIRINLVILAEAYEVEAIDVVSMNISDKNKLEREILDGFKCGYSAKFLIHPFQLKILKSFQFFTYEEVNKYSKILNYYKNEIKGKNALFAFEGNVYEKMHIKQFEKIVNWGEDFYGTNR